MNFYKRYMGDYARKTAHLSLAQRGAYDSLLDHYYSTRRPLPADLDSLCRICNAHGQAETETVSGIVMEFFPLNGDGSRHNKRADEEIKKWELQAIVNKRVGQLGGRPKKTESVSENNRTGFVPEVRSQKLEVINQKQEKALPSRVLPNPLNAATWDAYSSAYAFRYGADPVRNASTNSCIANVVKHLGSDSPHVASFYLTHNDQWYIKKRHPVKALLADAEGLRTQWKTGRKSTSLEARSAEQKDAVVEQIKRVSANIERKENAKNRIT